MLEIQTVSGGVLRPATWRSTYVLKPDQKVLAQSLATYGWLSPIVVNAKDNTIIDGHERWMIAGDDREIADRDGGLIPVRWVECDDIDAMLLHVQLNRGRGAIQARPLSHLLRKVMRSRKYSEMDVRKMLSMGREEFDLLINTGLLKSRKLDEHVYSRAWVPVEAPAGATAPNISIERPPNEDR